MLQCLKFLTAFLLLGCFLYGQSGFQISEERHEVGFLQEDPKLYFSPQSKIIVAWKDHRYGQPTYFAQRYTTNLQPIAENFEIFSNTNLVLNKNDRLFCSKKIDISYIWADCSTTYGAVYEDFKPVSVGFEFYGYCYGWLDLGFTGEDRVTVATNKGFLFLDRFDRSLSLVHLDYEGSIINNKNSLYKLGYNKSIVSIDMASLNDSLKIVSWLEFTDFDTLTGVYFGLLDEKDTLISKNELVIESMPVGSTYYGIIPEIKVKVLPGDQILILVYQQNKQKLYYYNISDTNHVTNSGSISLASFSEEPYIDGPYLTNISDGFFYLFFRERVYPTYKYFGYKFDDSGRYTGVFFEDSSSVDLLYENFNYTGNENFIITEKSGRDVYLYKTERLQKIDSVKMNMDLPNSNEHNSKITAFNEETFFVSWISEGKYYGRKVGKDGAVSKSVYPLAGLNSRFVGEHGINFWYRGINFIDQDFNIIKTDTIFTNGKYGKKVTAEILSDSLVIVAFAIDKSIILRKYDILGNLIDEKEYAKSNLIYDNLKIYVNDNDTFWLQSRRFYVGLFDENLEVLKGEIRLNALPLLKLENDKFFCFAPILDVYTSYAGYLLNSENDTIQIFDKMPPYESNFKAEKIDEKSFLLIWPLKNEIWAKVYYTDGHHEPSFILNTESVDPVSYVDGAFGRLGDKAMFAWSDNRTKEEGYSIYGRIVDINTITSVENTRIISPDNFSLGPAYPNPFNPSTRFNISIPERLSGFENL